ncbi:MAG TPA: glycine/sarcosine/betaine reductase selenoprotein B family protein [Thermoanaerobaculia bacterium]|nr:glycine/sarcosine/betaine reductase selenoprotein B family protein [Thermoanaerobaculia bacterium]
MPIDSYRYLDFASRQIMKAWAARERAAASAEGGAEPIPFTPLPKPLRECTVALLTTAGVALRTDRPFDQEGERRNPWWGDPTFREIPLGTTEAEIKIYHLHINPRFGEADLDVVLPMRRLGELAAEGVVGRAAPTHYSTMGYILEARELVEKTAPAIAARMRAEGVDAAALFPS